MDLVAMKKAEPNSISYKCSLCQGVVCLGGLT